jgi:hypothetical protein
MTGLRKPSVKSIKLLVFALFDNLLGIFLYLLG